MHTASTETLFRFVTMRKPEKAPKNFEPVNFITKLDTEGFFQNELENPLANVEQQMEALIARCKQLKEENQTFLYDSTETENNYSALIALGDWLFENGEEYKNNEIALDIDIKSIGNIDVNIFWNIIFYNLVTNENPKLLQMATKILVAYNFKIAENEMFANWKHAATATVLIPEKFYGIVDGNDALQNRESNTTAQHFGKTAEFAKQKTLQQNQDQAKSMDKLLSELEELRKVKNREYLKNYNDALTQHNNQVSNIIAETPYTIDPITGERIYENLNLPEFTFDSGGIENLTLSNISSLSARARFAFQSLGLSESEINFENVTSAANTARQYANNSLYGQTPHQAATAIVGNATITTAQRLNPNVSVNAFQVEAKAKVLNGQMISHYSMLLHVKMPFANSSISSLNIKFKGPNLNDKYFNYYQDLANAATPDILTVVLKENNDPSISQHDVSNLLETPVSGDYIYSGRITFADGATKFLKGTINLDVEAWDAWTQANTDIIRSHLSLLPSVESNGMLIDSEPNNANACVATNITVVEQSVDMATDRYTINFTPPNSSVFDLKLHHRVSGTSSWNIDGHSNSSPISIDLPRNLYEFKIVSLAEGVCNNKETPIFTFGTRIGTGNASNSQADTIPSKYGIQNIGIAEFRRVEQTVCSLQPSEVAIIENLMKGEYKQKTTRLTKTTELTTTKEKSTETQQESETNTAERFSMQSQTSQALSQSFNVNAGATYNTPKFLGGTASFNLSTGFSSSKQQSSSQSVNFAKDVTARAVERIVKNYKEQVVSRVSETYEELNSHGLDNRKGGENLAGIYYFLDKIYKNQIFNYGKRQLFEFVIPQPAKFHTEAMKMVMAQNGGVSIAKPVDPRLATSPNSIGTYKDLTVDKAAYWASLFNTEMEEIMPTSKVIAKGFGMNASETPKGSTGNYSGTGKVFDVEIPEGYEAVSATIGYSFAYQPPVRDKINLKVRMPNFFNQYWMTELVTFPQNATENPLVTFSSPIQKNLAISVEVGDMISFSLNVAVACTQTQEAKSNWQMKTFKAIIDGYNAELKKYEDAVNAAKQNNNKATNPLFYREIENTVLKKYCMDYLVGPSNLGKHKFYTGTGIGKNGVQATPNATMQQQARLANFLETAFEWEIMSYQFQPFYWGSADDWQEQYQVDCDDALFKNFLQAGMAKVILSVRPGFEHSVLHYMATGLIVEDANRLLLNNDLHKNLAYEMANPTYTIEKTWTTKVPSSFVIINKNNAALNLNPALPNNCGLPSNNIESAGNMEGHLTDGK